MKVEDCAGLGPLGGERVIGEFGEYWGGTTQHGGTDPLLAST